MSKKLTELIENFVDSINRFEKDEIARGPLKKLSRTQIHYIDTIYHNRELSFSDLAGIFKISKPSVTVHIEKLEKLGLVNKVKSDEDRRSSHLHLTEEGLEMALLHDRIHEEYTKKITKRLSAKEKTLFRELLEKLV